MKINQAIEKTKRMSYDKEGQVLHFGFSGGVDSSVLGVISHLSGLNVRGFHLVCWDEGEYCSAPEDLKDAVSITSLFGIKLDVIDLKEEYKRMVVGDAIEKYKLGYVPNIDIVCNDAIKFGASLRYALSQGGIYGTGHYATISEFSDKGLNFLTFKIPLDKNKDQTYFLSRVVKTPSIFNRLFFPGGIFTKSEIRDLAVELNLPNFSKSDSQGICFVGNIGMKAFLGDYIDIVPGKILDIDGNTVGHHDGIAFYTIGQRHGLDIIKYSAEPLYIVEKKPLENLLVVGPKELALKDSLTVENPFFLFDIVFLDDFIKENRLFVRFRNLGSLVPVSQLQFDGSNLAIKLKDKEFGLTPGQEAVFYIDDYLVGFGTIGFQLVEL